MFSWPAIPSVPTPWITWSACSPTGARSTATAASATTGDTRGTYALQTPSDGTLKLTVYQALDFGVIAGSYAAVLAALVGVPQF